MVTITPFPVVGCLSRRLIIRWSLYLTVGVVMSQTDPSSEIPQARVLEALETAAREVGELRGRMSSLETMVTNLETSLNEKVSRLEGIVGNTNAHLDNVAREANRANTMLETDIRDRRTALERKEKEEAEEKKRQQAIADDNRETFKRSMRELWAVFKQPLGFLVAGAFAWFVYQYMSVPQNMTLPLPRDPTKEVTQPQEVP